jgi:hypothetical protein
MQTADLTPPRIGSPTTTAVLNAAFAAVAVGLLGLIAVRFNAYQWDFGMFCWSAQDFLDGKIPYKGEGLSFYHPPITLYLYRLFLYLPRPVGYELWFAMKLGALAGLVAIWRRHFEELKLNWLTIAYFMLAFNGALYSDLVAGNVSLFEQLGLWLGFSALLQGRYARFCLCLVLVAQFKLTPIFFAVLLLFVPERPQWRWMGACLAGFVAVFSLNYLLQPVLLAHFFKAASGLDERIATGNAAVLTLIRDVLDGVRGKSFSAASRLDDAMFMAGAATVALVSLAAAVRYRLTVRRPDPKVLIYFACLIFTLISPRMKIYSYILLLIPTLGLLRRISLRGATIPAAAVILAAFIVFPNGDSLLPMRKVFDVLYHYLPLGAAILVWYGYLRTIRDEVLAAPQQQEAQLAAVG